MQKEKQINVQPKNYNTMKKILSIILIASIGGFISLGVNRLIDREDPKPETRPFAHKRLPVTYANYIPKLPTNGPDFKKAAEKTIDAVVHIKTEYDRRTNTYNDFFGSKDPLYEFFWGTPRHYQQKPIIGYGSGVIITDDGYIVTNNHVVQDADRVEVTLNDKRSLSADVIGKDPNTDLALIKVDEKNLPFITMGNSDSVHIGEWVLAVGNPFNLTSTVTAGIVSAKGRNINILGGKTPIESFIQTDAAVNKGNSGGALVNTYGELIGINAAIASNTGSYSGYAFAIPINIVKKVVDDLLVYGEVQRAFLGITFVEVTNELAKEKNIDEITGVYVVSVNENGSAADANIKPEDIITGIDGQEINQSSQLLEIVGRHRPGDEISITYKRDGKKYTKDVVLKNRLGTTDLVKHAEKTTTLGATFEELTNKEKQKYNLEGGLKIVELARGKLRQQGIREGFIITHINNKPITSIKSLKKVLKSTDGGVLIEGIYPNGMKAYYGFGL